MARDVYSKNKNKYLIFLSLSATLVAISIGLFFQNCGRGGFEALPAPDSISLVQSGSTSPGPGPTPMPMPVPTPAPSSSPDPNLTKMGQVSYGLFNKIVITNGVVPEGQLGKAVLVRSDSKTYVYVLALGLTPSQTYMSHVHADTCANGAGGHFKNDPTITVSDQNNEIWLTLNTDTQGVGYARTEVPFVAGTSAVSIVVHNLDGSKYLCADLTPQQGTNSALSQWSENSFKLQPTAKPGSTIAGNATKVVLKNHMSGFHISVWGLTPGATYPVHVHQAACSTGGGGHFLLDAAAAGGAANEVWLPLTASTTGSGTSEVWVNQVTSTAQTGALSIVIHDPTDSSKQACADLTPITISSGVGGLFQLTNTAVDRAIVLTNTNPPAGSGAGYQSASDLNAAPATAVQVASFGLLPNTMYHAHVHTLPCRMGAGGHYKIDPTVTASVEANEIWLMLNIGPDKIGTSTVTAPAVLRADAMSLVIHDPTDSSKLLCSDLL